MVRVSVYHNHCIDVIDLKHIPGKVVYVEAAGQPMVILNDVDLANELLDKKGATCSNRPVLNMACELAGFKELTGFLMYGQRFKESRKYIHRAIGSRESLKMFHTLFQAEIRNFLKATLRDPDDIQEHIHRYKSRLSIFLIEGTDLPYSFAGAIIVRITYGYEAQEKEDPIITLAESAMARFSKFSEPGAYLVDFISLCTSTSRS